MAVLHTIASWGDDGAEAIDDSSVTQEHVEQIDASSDELEILEAESVAAAAAIAAAEARLRFLRARSMFAQVSQASAKSESSAPGPAMRPLWLPAAEDLPDRGPLATVSLAPPVVRRAAEPAIQTAADAREEVEEGTTQPTTLSTSSRHEHPVPTVRTTSSRDCRRRLRRPRRGPRAATKSP